MSQNRMRIKLNGDVKIFEPHPTVSVEAGRITSAGIIEPFVVVRFPTAHGDVVMQFEPGDLHEPMRLAQLLVEAVDKLIQEKQKCPFQQ